MPTMEAFGEGIYNPKDLAISSVRRSGPRPLDCWTIPSPHRDDGVRNRSVHLACPSKRRRTLRARRTKVIGISPLRRGCAAFSHRRHRGRSAGGRAPHAAVLWIEVPEPGDRVNPQSSTNREALVVSQASVCMTSLGLRKLDLQKRRKTHGRGPHFPGGGAAAAAADATWDSEGSGALALPKRRAQRRETETRIAAARLPSGVLTRRVSGAPRQRRAASRASGQSRGRGSGRPPPAPPPQ